MRIHDLGRERERESTIPFSLRYRRQSSLVSCIMSSSVRSSNGLSSRARCAEGEEGDGDGEEDGDGVGDGERERFPSSRGDSSSARLEAVRARCRSWAALPLRLWNGASPSWNRSIKVVQSPRKLRKPYHESTTIETHTASRE
jgi:hypothetical protein